MRKLAGAGAFALATGVAVLVSTSVLAQESAQVMPAPTGMVVTDGQIAQFKSALRLTSAQEKHWIPVAVALRNIARRQSRHDVESASAVQRVASRAAAIAIHAVSYKQLAAAATPLLRSLDEEQKRDVMKIARAMGIEHLAAF